MKSKRPEASGKNAGRRGSFLCASAAGRKASWSGEILNDSITSEVVQKITVKKYKEKLEM